MKDLYWWLALERAPYVGPVTMSKLITAFGSPKSALEANTETIKSKVSINSRIIEALGVYKPDESKIDSDIDKLQELGARVITRWDDEYPRNLSSIYDPPAMLFVRGTLRPEDAQAVAVVGSRASSNYGESMTMAITRDLVRAGFCIVSGLARGIDTVCHNTAINEGGRTLGVLGCGLDINYPSENRALVERMCNHGAVISEFRPGIEPVKTNFYRRNRIVSGLSKAVVVVEASRRSGSLITVNHALDQGRDVFAVPGNVLHERSRGPHHLIRQGAGLVENAQDIISSLCPSDAQIKQSFPETSKPNIEQTDMSELARKVYKILDVDSVPVDNLCQMSKLETRLVLAALMELELLGLVRQSPGKLFSRIM